MICHIYKEKNHIVNQISKTVTVNIVKECSYRKKKIFNHTLITTNKVGHWYFGLTLNLPRYLKKYVLAVLLGLK